MNRKLTISCGTIPYRINDYTPQILLVKSKTRNLDCWGIPKGHINNGETIEQCALRETFEETGLNVKIEKTLQQCLTRNKKEIKTVYVFLASVIDGQLNFLNDPDNEIEKIEWFDINNLPNIYNYQQKVISEAINNIKQKHI